MQQNVHLELLSAQPAPVFSTEVRPDAQDLQSNARELAHELVWLPNNRSSTHLRERGRVLSKTLRRTLRKLDTRSRRPGSSDDFSWLYDNARLLSTELESVGDSFKRLRTMPHVRDQNGAIVPRVAALGEALLATTAYRFSEEAFTSYLEAFQQETVLKMEELWVLVPVLKLLLLEQIAVRASQLIADPSGSYGVTVCVHSLRDVGETAWKDLLEPLIRFDQILREDPTGDYSRMDFDSRDLYRNALAKIAKHSDFTEMRVAAEVLALAREAAQRKHTDPRLALRRSHVGYYLLAEGVTALYQRVGFKAPFGHKVVSFLRRHPDEFYLPSIELVTFAITSVLLLFVIDPQDSFRFVLYSLLLLFLPCSQAAVQLTNYLITSLMRPQILPKLDLSERVPDGCMTLVAIPSLLLGEDQVRRLVDEMEVRFLGNHDRNLHFALLTDMPDSREEPREDDPLVSLCSELVAELNHKYAGQEMGSFLMFHRHRVYNPRERVWMGWERKRGKLMDLNRLLRGRYDSFPVKVGDRSILPRVRFVITLDSDTELPRGAAHRMIGALAHPLNQAIIDAESNTVVIGYGILQPRVGVGVQSTARSRLANIYSGETGFDIYSRAVSDVYQDLFGEGIFAGKGIYEVDTVNQVLARRFPRNALLSHDLIEGAYARAGLASDIEVIEDYPSQYSAYNRRKHRWLRGDWQIAGWLLPYVSDESGQRVRNPLSIISQWKIFDNLRRSLVEPATFLLLVLGWLVLPGSAWKWTLATLGTVFLPAWFQFAFSLVRSLIERRMATAQDALSDFFAANLNVFLMLTFLAHQTLLSVDAVVRTSVRRILTRRRLLEWETSAQVEHGVQTRTPVDTYLDWTPAVAFGLGVLVFLVRRHSMSAALPILLLWASSRLVSSWLNLPSRPLRNKLPERDENLLRRSALRTWRYFAEFCTEEHNWLIPDNVQEEPVSVAGRISPTNLGFLLNARQVACTFGYLTVPEFTQQTLRTLASVSKLPGYRGHLLNWYDTRTLQPLLPAIVSTVDSGNLMASLWTLQQGCLKLLNTPVLQPCIAEGLLDHLRVLVDLRVLSRRQFSAFNREMKNNGWLRHLLEVPERVLGDVRGKAAKSKRSKDALWFSEQTRARLETVRRIVSSYTPWLLPEFAPLCRDLGVDLKSEASIPALERLPDFIDDFATRLRVVVRSASAGEQNLLTEQLAALLPEARANAVRLVEDLRAIAATAGELADKMDFHFLLNPRRKLLSVGFDVESQQVHPACYDLLATESRIASFAAIAKEDIRQENWFMLGRAHTLDHGRPVLLSWTGTMFEYLMPLLWMRTYPNTLLGRSASAAVLSQQAYAASKRIPWGISESAHSRMDEAGNYQYYAFGIPQLALGKRELNALVISPYSTFLALHVDASASLQNLHAMENKGWLGSYGFYEAADYTPSRKSWLRPYKLVRCWMAHHQGMSLLSIANLLHDDIVQQWFHSDPRVQATELLLNEKPVAHFRPGPAGYGASAA
jgi:cyclic beta-1,2-glucan synthetase